VKGRVGVRCRFGREAAARAQGTEAVLDAPRLIRLDAAGGLFAGAAMLLLADTLAPFYGLPGSLLRSTALANVAYGCVSATLAARSRSGRVPLLRAMAIANLAWAGVCGWLAAAWMGTASTLGTAHFVAEGAFVGILGALEWRAAGCSRPESGPEA
jgi:hypothetical protein